jgi:hypothetical protein
MESRYLAGAWELNRRGVGPDQEKLDRVLVGGLLLETILEAPRGPLDPEICRRFIKNRLKHKLVTCLAGRVTLDHFRTLVNHLDRWLPRYYPLVLPSEAASGGSPEPLKVMPFRDPASHPVGNPLREEALDRWLAEGVRQVLPQRPHRKLNPRGLREFLHRTRGGCFRVKDFEAHFRIDRKTAWEYLKKLCAAGLLYHNGERSAAVRYCLADALLVVKASALRLKTAAALENLPRVRVQEVADWLIASGGDAFWVSQFPGFLKGPRRAEVLARLEVAGILETAGHWGVEQLLRLTRPWLQKS